jgi:cytochrome c-type biogenesis protein CcmH/NrfG
LSAVELIRLAQADEGSSARILLAAGTSCLNNDPAAPEPVVLLREAIARDPSLHKAYYLLGRAYTRQGKLEEAAAAYRRAVELHPDASYYVNLGKALQSRQDSIAQFERALALDPSYAQAHLELGRVFIQLEERATARRELEKAIELEPDYYEAYYLLGRLLHRVGDEQQSHRLLTLFEEKKNALLQQSVIGAGFVADGH